MVKVKRITVKIPIKDGVYCCGKRLSMDFLQEGDIPNQDGSKDYRAICQVCGKMYILRIVDTQYGFE